MNTFRRCLFLVVAIGLVSRSGLADEGPLTREKVLEATLRPYDGPSEPGVDRRTLDGKVMCGYQGWFNAEGDGAERGWVHWSRDRKSFAPGTATVDLLPDVTELGADERFATGFTRPDGSPVEVFSSFCRPTVLRHFEWMREYGIDGVFVQRFISGLRDPRVLRHTNTVLNHCREGANRSGRAYAVMYDLSGLGANRIEEVMEDWRALRERMRVTEDQAYLHHRGKPLVTVWGIGFNDRRAYTLAECHRLVEFLKADGCSVMVGIPTYWRELRADCLPDPELHEILKKVDVVSPWTVGRHSDLPGVRRYAEKVLASDLAWCRERQLDYLPVVFPGFTWHNLKDGPSNQIPRLKGEFLWSQFQAAKRSGATMIYVAMFDEVDEGTAIFKCTNEIPEPGRSKFVSYDGLPSDYYLRLTGAGARMLRGEIPVDSKKP